MSTGVATVREENEGTEYARQFNFPENGRMGWAIKAGEARDL